MESWRIFIGKSFIDARLKFERTHKNKEEIVSDTTVSYRFFFRYASFCGPLPQKMKKILAEFRSKT